MGGASRQGQAGLVKSLQNDETCLWSRVSAMYLSKLDFGLRQSSAKAGSFDRYMQMTVGFEKR